MRREYAFLLLEQLSHLGVHHAELDVLPMVLLRDLAGTHHLPGCTPGRAVTLTVLDRLRRATEVCDRCFAADPQLLRTDEEVHRLTQHHSLLEALGSSSAFQRRLRLEHFKALPPLSLSVLEHAERALARRHAEHAGDPGFSTTAPRVELRALVAARVPAPQGSPLSFLLQQLRDGQGVLAASSRTISAFPFARGAVRSWLASLPSTSQDHRVLVALAHGVRLGVRLALVFPDVHLELSYADVLATAFPQLAGDPTRSVLSVPHWALPALRQAGALPLGPLSCAQAEVFVALWDPSGAGLPAYEAATASRILTPWGASPSA